MMTLPFLRIFTAAVAGAVLAMSGAATHAQAPDPAPHMTVDHSVFVERQPLPPTLYQFLPGMPPGRGPAPFLQFSRNGLTLLEVGPFGELNLGAGGIRFAPESFIPAAQVASVGRVVGYIGVRVGSSSADWRFVLLPVFELRADASPDDTAIKQ